MSGNPKPGGCWVSRSYGKCPLSQPSWEIVRFTRFIYAHFNIFMQQNIRQIPEGWVCTYTSVYRPCPQFWGSGRFSCRSGPTAHHCFVFFSWIGIIVSSLLLLLHIRTCLALLTCWDQQITTHSCQLPQAEWGWCPASPPSALLL